MKIIQWGERYNLHDDSVKTFDMLPPKSYTLEFDPEQGCYLMEHADIKVTEKAYGVQDKKIQKVMTAFEDFQRNLGVILSGDKGIGKTMFAKRLCEKAIEQGIPVVIVENQYPEMVRFIERIEQKCLVLFDEFDKLFDAQNECEYEDDVAENGQTELLSLFDGTSGGKKLFVVTCNTIDGLNSYLINRPGRFHYHFRFDYPSETEIEKYLSDKLEKEFYCEIPKVLKFSRRVKLNYDCLRAIAFELNRGVAFEEAISDLNIVNAEEYEYDVTLHFQNGAKLYKKRLSLDLYDGDESDWESFYDESGKFVANVKFNKSHAAYDEKNGTIVVPAKSIVIDYDDCDEDDKEISRYMRLKPERITLLRSKERNLHYFL